MSKQWERHAHKYIPTGRQTLATPIYGRGESGQRVIYTEFVLYSQQLVAK